MEPPQKPVRPDNSSKWWYLPAGELTEEQLRLRRKYNREYKAWRIWKKTGVIPKTYKKNIKLPSGVGEWWNKRAEELTEEQLKIRRDYINANNKAKYANDEKFKRKFRETQKKYVEKKEGEIRLAMEKAKILDDILDDAPKSDKDKIRIYDEILKLRENS